MNERFYHESVDSEPALGIAYVPWQKLKNIYENLEEAFRVGTLFPELTKPFSGKRG